MLDIRRIRLEPDVIKELLARRGEDVSKIDALLALDVERRKVMTESESRKAEQNRIGPQIAQRRKAGEDTSDLMAASTELKSLLVGLEENGIWRSIQIGWSVVQAREGLRRNARRMRLASAPP